MEYKLLTQREKNLFNEIDDKICSLSGKSILKIVIVLLNKYWDRR